MFKIGDRVKSVRTCDEFDIYENYDPFTGLNVLVEFGEFGTVVDTPKFNKSIVGVKWDNSGMLYYLYKWEVVKLIGGYQSTIVFVPDSDTI